MEYALPIARVHLQNHAVASLEVKEARAPFTLSQVSLDGNLASDVVQVARQYAILNACPAKTTGKLDHRAAYMSFGYRSSYCSQPRRACYATLEAAVKNSVTEAAGIDLAGFVIY